MAALFPLFFQFCFPKQNQPMFNRALGLFGQTNSVLFVLCFLCLQSCCPRHAPPLTICPSSIRPKNFGSFPRLVNHGDSVPHAVGIIQALNAFLVLIYLLKFHLLDLHYRHSQVRRDAGRRQHAPQVATVVSAVWYSNLYVHILFVYYLVHPVSLGITLLLFQVEDLGLEVCWRTCF